LLPSNLLRVKISRGKIRPVFVALDPDAVALARSLIDEYREGVGRKKRELLERLKEVENQGHDFKLVRGLSALLERRCVFEADSGGLNPIEARRAVFREASRARASSAEERERVLRKVSTELRVSAEALERTLFSDVDDELILRGVEPLDPKTLLKQYNLSVTQTLLFKALRVEFSASGNWKNIFRDVKWLGLIYSVERPAAGGADEKEIHGGQDRFRVSLDGPLSLFKMTERYGTAIARLLPQIAASDSWSIKAEILARSRGGKVYTFEIDSEEAKGLIADVTIMRAEREGQQSKQPRAGLYDSTTEANFASAFLSYGTGWKLRREPEPLVAGTHVLIPDFVFEKDGMRVYLEVVGFWTPEYLERKIAKLSLVSGVDMIIAADESLACSRLQRLSGKALVIYYKREVPIKPIIDHLREREGSLLREQVERIKGEGGAETFSFKGDVVSIEDIAKQRGVSVASMKLALQGFTPDGYVRVGDRLLVSRSKLEEIDGKLRGVQMLSEALAVIEACGVKEEGGSVLEALGYASVWEGLEMEKVKISKKQVSTASAAAAATSASIEGTT
jgi:uncharacterized protein